MINRNFKRVFSLFIILVILLSSVSILAYANEPVRDIPVIYVCGYGAHLLMKQEDGTEKNVYPAVNTDELLTLVKENKNMFAKAFITQDWSEFDDWVVNFMTDKYQNLLCDSNGNSINNIRADVDYSDEWFKTRVENYKTDVEAFIYEYDFRLDPFDQMEALRSYVKRVQAITGQQEYAMIGRCLGANLVLTYMEKYHDPNLKKISFYTPAFKGASPVSESFSGDMTITAEGIERFLYQKDLNLNIDTGLFTINDDVIREFATVAVDLYGLDYAVWAINNVFDKISEDILPRMMRSSLGTFPGLWAMVDDIHFEDAKKYIFCGHEKEYDGLINKIDNFHYKIMNRAENIINDARAKGVYVANIVKYDYSNIPIGFRQNELGDYNVFTSDSSLGAKCADVGKKIDESYLANERKKGNKHISPDNKIDASTCLLPETTWFLKNSDHGEIPSDLNKLFKRIFSEDNFTVFDDANFPQYIFFDREAQAIYPVTKDSKSIVEIWYEETHTPTRCIKEYTEWMFKLIVVFSKIVFLPPRYY